MLLESAVRNWDGFQVSQEDVTHILNWDQNQDKAVEIPFHPARVILQDFTYVGFPFQYIVCTPFHYQSADHSTAVSILMISCQSHLVHLHCSITYSGVPAVVDFAAMRDAVKSLGGDPAKINPVSPADLVIDHSVQVDVFRRLVCVCVGGEVVTEGVGDGGGRRMGGGLATP